MPRRLPIGVVVRAPARALRRAVGAHPRAAGVLVLVAVLVGGGWLWIRDSALVRVHQVEVVGATGPEGPEIRAALIRSGQTMTTLHVRRSALLASVRSYVTVRDVHADPSLLHRLRVVVRLRPAVAAVTVAGQRMPIAADGTLLRGMPVPRDVPALLVDRNGLRALRLVAAAAPALRAHLTRVFVGAHGYEADLRAGPVIYLGDARRARAKWVAAARVLSDPGARDARYLDVRLPERAVAGGLPEARPSTSG